MLYMLDAQLFLQAQPVPHSGHCLSYGHCFSLTVRTSEGIHNPGTGVIQSLTRIKGIITDK